MIESFLQGLRERGYVEGTNIVIEYRFSEDRNDRLPELAAELIAEGEAHPRFQYAGELRGQGGHQHNPHR